MVIALAADVRQIVEGRPFEALCDTQQEACWECRLS